MDAGHTGKTKGYTRDHTRHNAEKPRGDKMTISEQKYQELKDERVAHFADKTKIKLILSLRTHRGTLTKILGLMEGCTASVRALPSQRGAEELEALTDKAEAKMDDIEYGYDVLCALDNSEEEKYRAAVDKATEEYVAARKAASEALAAARPKAPQATGARNTSMVKIRDGLRPEKLKLEHTPTEFKNWKEEVKTYFTASNLMYASNREQRGYFRTCLSAELATRICNHIDIHEESPVLSYKGQPEPNEKTCMDAIELEFQDRYPLTARRHEAMQYFQQPGMDLIEFLDKMYNLSIEGDMMNIPGDELIATMMICGTRDEEMKKELMKMDRPSTKAVLAEAKAYNRQKANMRKTSTPQKAYVANSNGNNRSKKEDRRSSGNGDKIECWSCGAEGHRSRSCTKKKEDLHCKKCKKSGHVSKVCRGGPGKNNKGQQARQARGKTIEEESESSDSGGEEEVKAARVGTATPPFLL